MVVGIVISLIREKVFLSMTDRRGGRIMIMNSSIELIKKENRKIINK